LEGGNRFRFLIF